MKLASRLGFCLGACLFASGVSAQTFDLSFGGPDGLEGRAGDVIAADYNCMLTPGGELDGEGAQGWSLSVSAEGASIVGISVAGTIGDEDPDGLRDGGFEKSETTTASRAGSPCEGRNGAVSAIVLSFTQPITAPIDGASPVAVVSIEKEWVQGGSATLSYTDGCQGSGQPVNNNVTHKGATVKPSVVDKVITCDDPPPSCPQPGGISVLIEADRAEVPEDGVGPVLVTGAPGENTIYGVLNSDELPSGIQGWSFSVAVGGDLELVSATIDGTAGAEADEGGFRDGGFEKTEVVDAALDAQGQGAVSAIVLSFTQPITLEPTSRVRALCVTVSGELGQTGTLRWVDGLRGSGQPVNNVATVGGGTEIFLCCQSADITIAEDPKKRYRAGNPNNDMRLDIADPIWIINELFRQGTPSDCPESLDANGDGMGDLSDATFLIQYLFEAGSAPESECIELDPDGTTCETQDICA